MSIGIIWLVIELFIWHQLFVMYPTHRTIINWLMVAAVLLQVFMLLGKVGRKYRISLDVNSELREAEDAMEEAMQDPDDPQVLTRYQGLSTKPVNEMNADELLEYITKLHGRTNH